MPASIISYRFSKPLDIGSMQSFLVSVVAILSTAFNHHVTGIPLSNFYPFGSTNGDTALPANDDGSSAPITVSMPFRFFDETRVTVFVSPGQQLYNSSGYRRFGLSACITHQLPVWHELLLLCLYTCR